MLVQADLSWVADEMVAEVQVINLSVKIQICVGVPTTWRLEDVGYLFLAVE